MSASRKVRSRNLAESVIDHLEKTLGDALKSIRLTDVRVGLIYTGVALSTGHGGVAYNFGEEASGCRCLGEAGKISGKTARTILSMANDWNMVKASIGIATANALSHLIFQRCSQQFESADVVDLVRRDDKVVMVGYLAPLVPKVESRVSELCVLERRPLISRRVMVLPDYAAREVLPEADVVLITGSTLVNKSIDILLELCKDTREVILIGPTASLVPDPLFNQGVTAEMGIQVTDTDAMLKVVSEGGGTRQLLRVAKKIALLTKGVD